MGTNAVLRQRRTAAQVHALAQVEQEIRANDSKGRCRYLREYAEAFGSYDRVLSGQELQSTLLQSDLILVGDYHALPASQRFLRNLIEKLAQDSRPMVLALEAILSRRQPILEQWMRSEMDERDLRELLRFDYDWGYDWQPYAELLGSAKKHAAMVYGIDSAPASGPRRIAVRDRHAATRLCEIRERHPEARVLVLFGESHLAPAHLPALLRRRLPDERILTVLQNVDSLYWQAAGERSEHVEAVSTEAPGVICVFTSTPLEKYESYRLCIERWRLEGSARLDLAPSVYNLTDALLRFLQMDNDSPSTGPQPPLLQGLLPEVRFRPSPRQHEPLLRRRGIPARERAEILTALQERGICHVAQLNAMLVSDFHLESGSEEAARFLYRACQGRLFAQEYAERRDEQDYFYAEVLEHALAYFGSRILCPARPPVRDLDVASERASNVATGELHPKRRSKLSAKRNAAMARQLGYVIGSSLYDAYLAGAVGKRFLRSLFARRLKLPGAPLEVYEDLLRRVRPRYSRLRHQ